jgi:urease accessory protein
MKKTLLAAGLLAFPALASAHVSVAAHDHSATWGQSLAAGLVHPLTGLDHLLAIVALSLWVLRAPRIEQVATLAAFTFLLVIGALLGVAGMQLPGAEALIGLSVVVLGAVVASGKQYHASVGLVVAGLFAIFHGFAHGAEMGGLVAAPYFAGFVASFLALAAGTIALGSLVESRTAAVLRPAGATIAAVGVLFMVGVL